MTSANVGAHIRKERYMLKRKMMHGILMLCALVFLSTCGEKQQVLEGETMGTYYSIKYVSSNYDSPSQSVLQTEIDRILERTNQMSTYRPQSELSHVSIKVVKLIRHSQFHPLLLKSLVKRFVLIKLRMGL